MDIKTFQERSVMKVVSTLVFAFVFLLASGASADLYQWEDEEGTVYITDSMERVPQQYRAKARVYESAPAGPTEQDAPEQPVSRSVGTPQLGPDESLYGGHTAEWWRQAFRVRGEQIGNLGSEIETRQRFVETFEAGRRFGQIFDADKVEDYKRYKEELPKDRERLKKLEAELEKLRKEAAAEDVPRDIWEGKKD